MLVDPEKYLRFLGGMKTTTYAFAKKNMGELVISYLCLLKSQNKILFPNRKNDNKKKKINKIKNIWVN